MGRLITDDEIDLGKSILGRTSFRLGPNMAKGPGDEVGESTRILFLILFHAGQATETLNRVLFSGCLVYQGVGYHLCIIGCMTGSMLCIFDSGKSL